MKPRFFLILVFAVLSSGAWAADTAGGEVTVFSKEQGAAEGVDWAAGKVRATGIGSPPQNTDNPANIRAMTQRAAVADAQRNLLRTVQQIKIEGGRTVGTIMQSRSGAERIQGYLEGYTIVSERELGDGRIEVILELPLTGPKGLSGYLAE
jgi:hypothetical protein